MALNGRRRARRTRRRADTQSAWTNTDKELYPSKVRKDTRWFMVTLDVISDIIFFWV